MPAKATLANPPGAPQPSRMARVSTRNAAKATIVPPVQVTAPAARQAPPAASAQASRASDNEEFIDINAELPHTEEDDSDGGAAPKLNKRKAKSGISNFPLVQ